MQAGTPISDKPERRGKTLFRNLRDLRFSDFCALIFPGKTNQLNKRQEAAHTPLSQGQREGSVVLDAPIYRPKIGRLSTRLPRLHSRLFDSLEQDLPTVDKWPIKWNYTFLLTL
jgi:hypothetical protein